MAFRPSPWTWPRGVEDSVRHTKNPIHHRSETPEPGAVRAASVHRSISAPSAAVSRLSGNKVAEHIQPGLADRREIGPSGAGGSPACLRRHACTRNARRKSSFSSAPCQLVPHTAPRRQPSRNGSAAGGDLGDAVVNLVAGAPARRSAGRRAAEDLPAPNRDPHGQQPEAVHGAPRDSRRRGSARPSIWYPPQMPEDRPAPGPGRAIAGEAALAQPGQVGDGGPGPGQHHQIGVGDLAGAGTNRTSTPGSAASASMSVKLLILGSRTTATRRIPRRPSGGVGRYRGPVERERVLGVEPQAVASRAARRRPDGR